MGVYPATAGFLAFSSEAAGSGLQNSHTKILSCAVSSCQDIFTHGRWTCTSLLKLCPTRILRMVQTLPAQSELLPGLPSPEQTQAMCCFPPARWRSGQILVPCTPQADKGKRKKQHFLLEESREKHLAWLLLLLSVCTVNTTTCYSHCTQQL